MRRLARVGALVTVGVVLILASGVLPGGAGEMSSALTGEAEAFGPRPGPYFQQLALSQTLAHTLANAGNIPYGGHAAAAVYDAGYLENLAAPGVPPSIQKVDTDLNSASTPRDAGPQTVASQDAGVAKIDGGTVEAHCKPQPMSIGEVQMGRTTMASGVVAMSSVWSVSKIEIKGQDPQRAAEAPLPASAPLAAPASTPTPTPETGSAVMGVGVMFVLAGAGLAVVRDRRRGAAAGIVVALLALSVPVVGGARPVLAAAANQREAVALAESLIGGIDIAGVVKISSIHQTATASSTAHAGASKASAQTEVSGVTVAGIPATIDADGVHAAGQGAAIPLGKTADQVIGETLAQAGISLRLMSPTMDVSKDGKYAVADAGTVALTILRTVGVPVPGTPQQDAGVDMNFGGARVSLSGALQELSGFEPTDILPLPDSSQGADLSGGTGGLPSVGPTPTDASGGAGSTQAGPQYRTVRMVIRHFEPVQTTIFLLALLVGVMGPLLLFRRNVVAAAVLASPGRGYRAFFRYLVRG
ncbi:MAG: hypothetical protein WDA71_00300 [Actinomycetota bacterium]